MCVLNVSHEVTEMTMMTCCGRLFERQAAMTEKALLSLVDSRMHWTVNDDSEPLHFLD